MQIKVGAAEEVVKEGCTAVIMSRKIFSDEKSQSVNHFHPAQLRTSLLTFPAQLFLRCLDSADPASVMLLLLPSNILCVISVQH